MKTLIELTKISRDDIETVSGAMDSIEAYIDELLNEIDERDDIIKRLSDELEASND